MIVVKDKRKFEMFKRIASGVTLLILGYIVALIVFFLATHPELISPIEKTSLERHINNGDEFAIEYYQDNYISNGIELFK